MDEAEVTEQVSPEEVAKQVSLEMEQTAMQRARDRARNARWDLNIAIFLFAVLILVIILLFQEIRVEVVALVAIFGLAMVWMVGWRQGRQLYQRFYNEELFKLKRGTEKKARETIEETIEETVQKALRERWK